eukprot:4525460-Prymnesium_polylepis.1
MVQELVGIIVKQYTHTPGGSADAHLALGEERKPIQAPIFAVAASEEAPLGETFEKMRGWKDLTSGKCELVKVDASHMGCMKFGNGGLFAKLLEQINPIIKQERTRQQLEKMGS